MPIMVDAAKRCVHGHSLVRLRNARQDERRYRPRAQEIGWDPISNSHQRLRQKLATDFLESKNQEDLRKWHSLDNLP